VFFVFFVSVCAYFIFLIFVYCITYTVLVEMVNHAQSILGWPDDIKGL